MAEAVPDGRLAWVSAKPRDCICAMPASQRDGRAMCLR
jgi:hypothetical protein